MSNQGIFSLPPELHYMISDYLSLADNLHFSALVEQCPFADIYSSAALISVSRQIRNITQAANPRWRLVDNAVEYLKPLDEILNEFLPVASTRQFTTLLGILKGTFKRPDFQFFSAAIRCILTVNDGPRAGDEHIRCWKAQINDNNNLANFLAHLKPLLEHTLASTKPPSIDRLRRWHPWYNCSRTEWKGTFMSQAIFSNNLDAVRLVWEVYHQHSKDTLEDSIGKLIMSTISNIHASSATLIPILEYLMDEWDIPTDYIIPDRCATIAFFNHKNSDRGLSTPGPTIMEMVIRHHRFNCCMCDSYHVTARTYLDYSMASTSPYHDVSVPREIVKLLLRRGADISGESNPIPKLLAAPSKPSINWAWDVPQIGPKGCLMTLLQAGADPNIIPKRHGITLLHLIDHPQSDDLPLFTLLAEKSTPYINQPTSYERSYPLGRERITPLQNLLLKMVFHNVDQTRADQLVPFVKILLEYGADPYWRDGPVGSNATMIAAAGGACMKDILVALVGSEEEAVKWTAGGDAFWKEQGCGVTRQVLANRLSSIKQMGKNLKKSG